VKYFGKNTKHRLFHVVLDASPVARASDLCVCVCACVCVCDVVFLWFQAPSSLLDALEQHLASLEGKKVKDSTAASRWVFSPTSLYTRTFLLLGIQSGSVDTYCTCRNYHYSGAQPLDWSKVLKCGHDLCITPSQYHRQLVTEYLTSIFSLGLFTINLQMYFIILFITLLFIILLLCLCCWYFEQPPGTRISSGINKRLSYLFLVSRSPKSLVCVCWRGVLHKYPLKL